MSTRNSIVALEAVTQQIIDLIGKDPGSLDVTADSSLQGQGLDSLKVISLVFKIEDHYDIVLAKVSLVGRPFRAENGVVVACRRRVSMVLRGR